VCLGIPSQVVSIGVDHPDLATVDMAGVHRSVNVGLMDGPLSVGDWVLVHMGFALQTMTEGEAQDAFRALGAERAAVDGLFAGEPVPEVQRDPS